MAIKMVHCTFPSEKPQPNFLHIYIKHFFIVLIYSEFSGNTTIVYIKGKSYSELEKELFPNLAQTVNNAPWSIWVSYQHTS